MNSDTQEPRPYSFLIGMMAGTVIGAGLALWLAPRAASELRERLTDSARSLRNLAGQQRQRAATSVATMAEDMTRRAEGVRDNIAEAVAHRAHEVEDYATAAQSDRVAGARKRSSTDRTSPASRNEARSEPRSSF
jgi:gas vesicle protein